MTGPHPWPARIPAEIPEGVLESPEGKILYNFIEANERRIDRIHSEMPELLRLSIAEALEGRMPSPDEHRWVQLAIQREAQSIALRKAIIEKTLLGLVWSAIAGAGGLAWVLVTEFAKNHGWKP